jgi:hypothetical protein
VADLLRAEGVDRRRRGKDQRAREESGELRTDLATGPALGGIVGRDEAFPRDENAHHRAPNYKRRNKKLNRPTQRALDAGDSAAFSNIFLASCFFCSQAWSTPAPPPSNARRWAKEQSNVRFHRQTS